MMTASLVFLRKVTFYCMSRRKYCMWHFTQRYEILLNLTENYGKLLKVSQFVTACPHAFILQRAQMFHLTASRYVTRCQQCVWCRKTSSYAPLVPHWRQLRCKTVLAPTVTCECESAHLLQVMRSANVPPCCRKNVIWNLILINCKKYFLNLNLKF